MLYDSQDAGCPSPQRSSGGRRSPQSGCLTTDCMAEKELLEVPQTHPDGSQAPLKAFPPLLRPWQLPLAQVVGFWVLLSEVKHSRNHENGVGQKPRASGVKQSPSSPAPWGCFFLWEFSGSGEFSSNPGLSLESNIPAQFLEWPTLTGLASHIGKSKG